jgi:5-(carboxyamino)imidazole ribonucleotide mutase
VIIAAAGLAAHLPGVLAAWTTLPVIGVPIESGPLAGQDALYAVVQMPPGVPVATVGINGSVNAAILAAQIIGVHHDDIRRQLHQYKATLMQSVSDRQKKIDQILNDRQVKTKQSLS